MSVPEMICKDWVATEISVVTASKVEFSEWLLGTKVFCNISTIWTLVGTDKALDLSENEEPDRLIKWPKAVWFGEDCMVERFGEMERIGGVAKGPTEVFVLEQEQRSRILFANRKDISSK